MLAIEMRNITKAFSKVIANDAVNLRVQKGEIHALIGENGAGKSTLMNILYGLYKPDNGKIFVHEQQVAPSSPADTIRVGIGMVHQHFMLIPPLTTIENIILGKEPIKYLNIIDKKKAEQELTALAEKYRMKIQPRAKVASLSVGEQQRVEILKVLYRNAEILILDEPTPILTPQEVEDLFTTLRYLKSEGKTIILITHKLNEVKEISDRVTVMRHGKVVGDFETSLISIHELAHTMVGKEIGSPLNKVTTPPTAPVLSVQNVSALNDRKLPSLRNVSFSVKGGEILGIAGVEGNGQAELVQVISGSRKPSEGQITLNGNSISQETKVEIAHIPEDRLRRGLILDFTLEENLILGKHRRLTFSNALQLKKDNISSYAEKMIHDYDIRPGKKELLARNLSGGNQQKVVIARELSKDADFILASQPTRGLDIGAIEFVHNSLITERNNGKAILLVSSDLTELLNLADRIAVIYEGEIVTTFETNKTSERELGLYMTGAQKRSA